MSDLPKAVWSGEIMGLKVHVLEDGSRIIDAESMAQMLSDIANGEDDDFDPEAFSKAFSEFMHGTTVPLAGTDNNSEAQNK